MQLEKEAQDITVKMADLDQCQWTAGLIQDFTAGDCVDVLVDDK